MRRPGDRRHRLHGRQRRRQCLGNQGRIFLSLKPLAERQGYRIAGDRPVAAAARQLARYAGLPARGAGFGIGGRAGNAQFQFVLLSPDLDGLETWSEALVQKLRSAGLTDVGPISSGPGR